MFLKNVLFPFVTILFCTSHCIELPSYFPKCKYPITDKQIKDFPKCFQNAAHASREFMRKGVPELGLPPISYVVIPQIEIEQKSRAYQFKCVFNEIGMSGLDGYEVENVVYNPKNVSYTGSVIFPHLSLNGTYELSGRIFGQNISQTGQMGATMNNTKAAAVMEVEYIFKKGVKYARFKDPKIDATIGDVAGHFDNLFGANEVLNKATNEFLSESTKMILESAKPEVIAIIKNLIMLVANRIAKSVPFHSVFPLPDENDE